MYEYSSQFDCNPGASAPSVSLPMMLAELEQDNDDHYQLFARGNESESGVMVTPSTALSHGPVYQAVRLLSGDVSILPFHKMKDAGSGREKDKSHPLWWLFTQEPNDFQTPCTWKETMMQWALLWGNAICYIDRVGGKPVGLYPLTPDRTSYVKEGGRYLITTWINNKFHVFHPWQTFHIRGLASDGFWGLSAVQVCKNVIGHGIAIRKHGNATFKNGAMPRAVLKVAGSPSKEIRRDLRDEWNEIYGGVSNANKIAILVQNAELQPMSLSNVDAQWLEAMKADREFTAAIFNIPNHKLNSMENSSTRANLEEQNLQYLMMALQWHLVKFKEESERKLLTEEERRSGDHYMKWVIDAFLRGNTKDRNEAYFKGRTGGWLSANEVRDFEDLPRIEGGDDYSNPVITVKEPGKNDNGDDDDSEVDDEKRNLARNVVRQMVQSMLVAEDNKVQRSAKGATNFMTWLDEFYGSIEDQYRAFNQFAAEFLQGPVALVALVVPMAGWGKAIFKHAASRKDALMQIAGEVNQEGLAEAVAAAKASVSIDQLTAEILEVKQSG